MELKIYNRIFDGKKAVQKTIGLLFKSSNVFKGPSIFWARVSRNAWISIAFSSKEESRSGPESSDFRGLLYFY